MKGSRKPGTRARLGGSGLQGNSGALWSGTKKKKEGEVSVLARIKNALRKKQQQREKGKSGDTTEKRGEGETGRQKGTGRQTTPPTRRRI